MRRLAAISFICNGDRWGKGQGRAGREKTGNTESASCLAERHERYHVAAPSRPQVK